MSNDRYYKKYIEYKTKYLNFKGFNGSQLRFQPFESTDDIYYYKYKKYKTLYFFRSYPTSLGYLNIKGGFNQLRFQPFEFTIKEPWFSFIKNGKKVVEGRLNKGIFSKLKQGDVITWKNKNLKIKVMVKYIKVYPSFKDMLSQETISRVLPNTSNLDKGVNIYHQYYKSDDEKQYGVVAIGMELMKPKIYESKLKDPYFEYVKSGVKTYEVRVNDEKRKKMKVGDIWIFYHNDKQLLPIETYITQITTYKTFKEAIEDTGVEKLLPNVKDINEGIKTYEAFPHDEGTYKEGAEKYGVVRFKLEINKQFQVHVLPIQNPKYCPTFDYIKNGSKTVEGRKYSEKYHKYRVNDILIFECDGEKLRTLIRDIRKYKTLNDYLEEEKYNKVLPCAKNMNEAIKIYNEWSKESDREELKRKYGYGFMGIEIEPF